MAGLLGAGLGFKGAEAYTGGHNYFALTATMSTTAELVKAGPGRVCRLINTQSTAQTNAIKVYDCANTDSTDLSSAQVIWQGALGASAIIDLQFPVQYGVVVQAAAAISGSILVTYT